MPKLYYTPTSCGAASFLAANIAGLTLECETIDLGSHKTASGADFYTINPKGNVPAIVLDDGTLLNEGETVSSLDIISSNYDIFSFPFQALLPFSGSQIRTLAVLPLRTAPPDATSSRIS